MAARKTAPQAGRDDLQDVRLLRSSLGVRFPDSLIPDKLVFVQPGARIVLRQHTLERGIVPLDCLEHFGGKFPRTITQTLAHEVPN
jgi:hypothetical protein